jgi:restriction system protein
MLPILEFLADKKEHRIREIAEFMANKFRLTEEEKRQLVPSGQQEVLFNRISWACSYLKKACLLETPQRGSWRIAPRGLETLASNPSRVNMGFLKQFPEYQAFRAIRRSRENGREETEVETTVTPLESLEAVYRKLREELVSELLERIKSMPPSFFERLVIDLLLRMGYGGSRLDAGKAIGRSGDGGIDGIINEDKLGLDSIYIQAKRWDGTVSRPEVQKIRGCAAGQAREKGRLHHNFRIQQRGKDVCREHREPHRADRWRPAC